MQTCTPSGFKQSVLSAL